MFLLFYTMESFHSFLDIQNVFCHLCICLHSIHEWTNIRSDGVFLLGFFLSNTEAYAYIEDNSSNNRCKIKKTTLQHRPDYLLYWLTFIYLQIQISFNRIESSARFSSSGFFLLLNLNNHYVIVLTTFRKSFCQINKINGNLIFFCLSHAR